MSDYRKILHLDMDCFYAQVEMRDNPQLKNVALAIGGPPGTRSVLCTSNYPARKFGVRAAMSSDMAVKKCPELVIVPPNFEKYQRESEIIMEVMQKYSQRVEPLSLDEAYVDLSHYPDALIIAKEIKEEILKATHLTCSVGLSVNKFLAKMASDWKKPNGIFVIRPHDIEAFLKELPVEKIPGVGKVTKETLNAVGIFNCTDLREYDTSKLESIIGKFAFDLKNYSQGFDDREVLSDWSRKSMSTETTFLKDISDLDDISISLTELIEDLQRRLLVFFNEDENAEELIFNKIFVKLKSSKFENFSIERMIPYQWFEDFKNSSSINSSMKTYFQQLLIQLFLDKNRPIRLLGVGVRLSHKEEFYQLELPHVDLRNHGQTIL